MRNGKWTRWEFFNDIQVVIQQAVDILFVFFFFMKNSEFFNFRMFNIDYDFQAIFHSDNKVKLIFFSM